MKFRQEVNEFKKINGNKTYPQVDMLRYMCSKLDKVEFKIDKIHESISGINIRLAGGDKDFKWIKTCMYFGLTLIGSLFYIVFGLYGFKFW